MTCPNQECKGEGKILMTVPDGDGGLRWVEEKCLTCKGKGYVVDEIWKQGFTFIELMIVCVIISIILAILIPACVRTKVVVNYGTTPHQHRLTGDKHTHLVEHIHERTSQSMGIQSQHTHDFVEMDHSHEHDDVDHDHDFKSVIIVDDPQNLNEFLNPKVD